MTTTTRTFTLSVHFEDEHVWAEVQDLPGCFASGRDLDELKEALAEAIGMYLDSQSVTSVELEHVDPVQEVKAHAELVAA